MRRDPNRAVNFLLTLVMAVFWGLVWLGLHRWPETTVEVLMYAVAPLLFVVNVMSVGWTIGRHE